MAVVLGIKGGIGGQLADIVKKGTEAGQRVVCSCCRTLQHLQGVGEEAPFGMMLNGPSWDLRHAEQLGKPFPAHLTLQHPLEENPGSFASKGLDQFPAEALHGNAAEPVGPVVPPIRASVSVVIRKPSVSKRKARKIPADRQERFFRAGLQKTVAKVLMPAKGIEQGTGKVHGDGVDGEVAAAQIVVEGFFLELNDLDLAQLTVALEPDGGGGFARDRVKAAAAQRFIANRRHQVDILACLSQQIVPDTAPHHVNVFMAVGWEKALQGDQQILHGVLHTLYYSRTFGRLSLFVAATNPAPPGFLTQLTRDSLESPAKR